jgi:ankyrin repeat protein
MDLVLQKAWETAVERIDLDACRDLIARGVDIHQPVLVGATALHFAVSQHSLVLARFFVEQGAQVDHPGDDEVWRTPLAFAVFTGNRVMAAMLIDAGASLSFVPEGANMGFLTPFQTLVRRGKIEDVRHYVLSYGVDLGQRTVAGKTLIQLCGGNAELKAMLRALRTERAIEGPVGASSVDVAGTLRRKDFHVL